MIPPINFSVKEWTSFCILRVRKFRRGIDPDLDLCGLCFCTGLGWNRVTFLCRRLCGPVVCICDQCVGNIPRFLLLLSSTTSVSRPFLLLTLPQHHRLKVHKTLWGDTIGTDHPKWTNRYPRPHHCVLINKTKENNRKGGFSEWGYLSSEVIIMSWSLLFWKWLNLWKSPMTVHLV